ncbi:MAG: hypothetical protein PVF77_10635, partial [Anaerolineae bacterium]
FLTMFARPFLPTDYGTFIQMESCYNRLNRTAVRQQSDDEDKEVLGFVQAIKRCQVKRASQTMRIRTCLITVGHFQSYLRPANSDWQYMMENQNIPGKCSLYFCPIPASFFLTISSWVLFRALLSPLGLLPLAGCIGSTDTYHASQWSRISFRLGRYETKQRRPVLKSTVGAPFQMVDDFGKEVDTTPG